MSTPTILTDAELESRAAERAERKAAARVRDFAAAPRETAVVATNGYWPDNAGYRGIARQMELARARKTIMVAYIHHDDDGSPMHSDGERPCEVLDVAEGAHVSDIGYAGWRINYTVRLHPDLMTASDLCVYSVDAE